MVLKRLLKRIAAVVSGFHRDIGKRKKECVFVGCNELAFGQQTLEVG